MKTILQKCIYGLCALVFVVVSTNAPVSAAGETFNDYSQMNVRSAGQFWADGQVAGQWAWSPTSPVESNISWGDPRSWPPDYAEKFIQSGSWVMLDGWSGNGTYYKLKMDREQIGNGSCQNLRDIIAPAGGVQHYVKWNVSSTAYCLKAAGTITEQSSGKVIQFGHTQIWSPPALCWNQYYGNQTCIKQWESWWDNNGNLGGPITRKLEREVQLARGIGMAFTVQQYFPAPWKADLRWNWRW